MKNCLNLGSGKEYMKSDSYEHWTNVDFFSDADMKHNLEILPYPFKDNSFDRIICFHTLEHIHTDMIDFMKEMYRLLKPEGILEIRTPHFSSWNAFAWVHVRQFNIRDFLLTYNNTDVVPPLKVIKAELHCYLRQGKNNPHWFYNAIEWLVNKNPVLVERFCPHLFGGFTEMEVIYKK